MYCSSRKGVVTYSASARPRTALHLSLSSFWRCSSDIAGGLPPSESSCRSGSLALFANPLFALVVSTTNVSFLPSTLFVSCCVLVVSASLVANRACSSTPAAGSTQTSGPAALAPSWPLRLLLKLGLSILLPGELSARLSLVSYPAIVGALFFLLFLPACSRSSIRSSACCTASSAA